MENRDEGRTERILRARDHWRTRAQRREGNPMGKGAKEWLRDGGSVGELTLDAILKGCSGKTGRRIRKFLRTV